MNVRPLILMAGVVGCSASLSGPRTGVQSSLRETATASITGSPSGPAVHVVADIQNVGGSTQSLVWGADCAGNGSLTLNVYRASGASRTLVWTSGALPRLLGCPTRVFEVSLEPGQHAQPEFTIAVAAILGDSIPAGSYTLGVVAHTTPSLDAEVPAGTMNLSTAVVDPPAAELDGTWTGGAHGLSISLALHWTADSVTGTGTYAAADTNSFGCGGGSFRGAGTIDFAAGRSHGSLAGGMQFSAGWDPPFGGILLDDHTIGGWFMSVDRGPCYLTLTRT